MPSTGRASPSISARTSSPRASSASPDAGLSSFERLSGSAPLLTDSEREFKYYSLGFGWNVLPGEVFLGGSRAYNSAVYLTAGAGSTTFAGGDRFTVTLGAGARLLIRDWLAVAPRRP
jgi:outer membrane beta-barrel protein